MTIEDLFNISQVGLSFGFVACLIVCLVSYLVGWLVGIIKRI